LIRDLERVRTHELIPDTVVVSGFVYDVDTGLLTFVG
jgi:carbonic anhydrase